MTNRDPLPIRKDLINRNKGKAIPSKIREDLFEEFIEWLCEGGSMRSFSEAYNLSRVTLVDMIERSKDTVSRYERAREVQAHYLADEILTIADDSSQDELYTEKRNGDILIKENHEFINRSRIRIDSRKWILAKLLPHKYGDFSRIEQKIKADVKNKHSGSLVLEPITGMQIVSSAPVLPVPDVTDDFLD